MLRRIGAFLATGAGLCLLAVTGTFAWLAGPSPVLGGQGLGTGCPPALTGRFSSAASGRRIALTVAVAGAQGTLSTPAILDSGASVTAFPDAFLRGLGFRPVAGPHRIGGVGRGGSVAYTYRIPYPLVDDGGQWVPLGAGTLAVEGIQGFDLALVGPDVLEAGVSLQTRGSEWTLTLPCAGGGG